MKRTPMNRGSGFARPAYTAPPPAPVQPLGRVPNYTRVEYSGGGRSIPKKPRMENPHLLRMARGKPCLLRCTDLCEGDKSQTAVACHSNFQEHGKGMGIKASDQWSCWGCSRCHAALDSSYRASYEERQQWFDAGHARQIVEWKKIAEDKGAPAKDIEAAKWALRAIAEWL